MKWLATLLLAANVGFYLWAGGYGVRGAGSAPQAAADVNREGMLLLHEVERRAGGGLCYRVGPFAREEDWLRAREWLRAQDFAHSAPQVVREMRVSRIYLGPFETRAAADAAAAQLARKGIEHFVYAHGGGVGDGVGGGVGGGLGGGDSGGSGGSGDAEDWRISLGYFPQPALAARYIAWLLESHDISASEGVEYPRMGPQNWVEARIGRQSREAFLARDWGGAAVTAVDCEVGAGE